MQRRYWLAVTLLFLLSASATAQQTADPHYPAPVFDQTPPALPKGLSHAVLIFSKTNGFRHVEHIPHSKTVLEDIAKAQGRATFTTENAAIFNPAQLSRFSVVVLDSASGDLFTPSQRAAFVEYLKRGGGLVAIHAAGGDKGQPWTYYVDSVIGARFIGHPNGADQFQRATINVTEPDDPLMAGIPGTWTWTDELYSFDRVPSGNDARILATLDERSYRMPPELAMGAVHPIIWTRGLGSGRIFFSALGHKPEAYDDPVYRRLLTNAIRWAGKMPVAK